MQTQPEPKTHQITVAFKQEPMRIGQRDFGKADPIASTKLCCYCKVDRDHVR
jgi:hypothetical protein